MAAALLAAAWAAAPALAPLKGVSESCAEFGQALPGALGTDYTWPKNSSISHFASAGFGAVRVPFLWERLQRTLGGDFNASYLSGLDESVAAITGAGMRAILDPHNYARYSTGAQVSEGQIIGAEGSAVTVAHFTDMWTRVAGRYKSNANVVFAVMNEPHTMPTRLWSTTAAAAVAAIRQAGATQLVLVPGNGWTGAHSWTENWYDSSDEGLSNADAFAGFSDPGNNFAFEMHQYLDSDSSGSNAACASATIGADGLSKATAWLEQHNFRGFIGEFGAGTSDLCSQAVDAMLAHMDAHPAWIGWTWWAAGPWWGDYFTGVEPNADGSDKPQVAWLQKHLTPAPAPPAPPPAPTPAPASGCPGGSLSGCMDLCPASPASAYKACVNNCVARC